MKRTPWLRLIPALLASCLFASCGGGDGQPGDNATPTGVQTPVATPSAEASPSPSAQATIPRTYRVQPGDTLRSIAARFGVTVADLVEANDIADPDVISVGQVLIIPEGGPPATPTSAPAATQTPSVSGPARVVTKGDASRREVALTFDAGSDTGYTAAILDTLRENGITASFGVTGLWAERNPDLLRRIVSEGHELINHTYDHKSFTGLSTGEGALSRERRWEELDLTAAAIQRIAGASTKPLFRPPYGDYDASVNADVGARGYAYNVLWTVDSQGWNGLPAQDIVTRCLSMAEPGAIYVFHVGSASQDAAALQEVIDGLRADGYGFVPVSEMLPR